MSEHSSIELLLMTEDGSLDERLVEYNKKLKEKDQLQEQLQKLSHEINEFEQRQEGVKTGSTILNFLSGKVKVDNQNPDGYKCYGFISENPRHAIIHRKSQNVHAIKPQSFNKVQKNIVIARVPMIGIYPVIGFISLETINESFKMKYQLFIIPNVKSIDKKIVLFEYFHKSDQEPRFRVEKKIQYAMRDKESAIKEWYANVQPTDIHFPGTSY